MGLIKLLRKIRDAIPMSLMDSKSKRHSLVGPAKLWQMKQEFQIKFLTKVTFYFYKNILLLHF